MKIPKTVLLLSLCLLGVVFFTGISTDLSLGDEIYHFRFAETWYTTEQRPLYDPTIETANQCLYYFDSDPAWAIGLMAVWKLTGGVSRLTTQLYQAAFLAGAIIVIYMLGRKLYGERIGMVSALVAASTPFLLAYSVLTYLEISAIFFSTTMMLFLLDRKFFWAGLAAGLAFLSKRNTWLLIPLLAIYLLTRKETPLRNTIAFVVPAGLLGLPELYYHLQSWGNLFSPPFCPQQITSNTMLWTPSNIFYNPLSIPQYLGAIILIGTLAFLVLRQKTRTDLNIIVPIVVYVILWIAVIPEQIAVRYFSPLFSLFCLLAGAGFVEIEARVPTAKRKIFYALFILIGLGQIFATLAYTYSMRNIGPDMRESFAFILETVPEDARLMSPDKVVSLETERATIWIGILELEELFWRADETRSAEIFKAYDIRYVYIRKNRIYDDSQVQHRLGYPASFLDRMRGYDWVYSLFQNPELEILSITLDEQEISP